VANRSHPGATAPARVGEAALASRARLDAERKAHAVPGERGRSGSSSSTKSQIT